MHFDDERCVFYLYSMNVCVLDLFFTFYTLAEFEAEWKSEFKLIAFRFKI